MFNGLIAYLDSIKARDPSPRSRWEILLYPGLLAVGMHRIAHWLFEAELFFLARFVNHLSRFLTAIDIHPGATVGRHLFIDHGFGFVIGETAVVEDDVLFWHSVTLGGNNPMAFVGSAEDRHPKIRKGAHLGANSTILGNIEIGAGAKVAAGSMVLQSVAPGVTVAGVPAKPVG